MIERKKLEIDARMAVEFAFVVDFAESMSSPSFLVVVFFVVVVDSDCQPGALLFVADRSLLVLQNHS
jgi:hypothetical protein